MAYPRVYRRQALCPECGSNRMPKDGHSKGRQVYHCGDALYPGTVPGRRNRGGGDGVTNRRWPGVMPDTPGITPGQRHTAKVADLGRALPPWTLGSAHHLAARRRTAR